MKLNPNRAVRNGIGEPADTGNDLRSEHVEINNLDLAPLAD